MPRYSIDEGVLANRDRQLAEKLSLVLRARLRQAGKARQTIEVYHEACE